MSVQFCFAQAQNVFDANFSDGFKNNLFKLDIYKTNNNELNAILYMTNKFDDTIHLLEKPNNEYVILIPEVKSSLVEKTDIKLLKDILELVAVETQPFSENPPLSGYTKITFKSTQPVKIITSVQVLNLPEVLPLTNAVKETAEQQKMLMTSKPTVKKVVAKPAYTKTVVKKTTIPTATYARNVYKRPVSTTYRRPNAPQVSKGVYKTATTNAVKPAKRPTGAEEPVMELPPVKGEIPITTLEKLPKETPQQVAKEEIPEPEKLVEKVKEEEPKPELSPEEQMFNLANETDKKPFPINNILLILGALVFLGGTSYLIIGLAKKVKKQAYDSHNVGH